MGCEEKLWRVVIHKKRLQNIKRPHAYSSPESNLGRHTKVLLSNVLVGT